MNETEKKRGKRTAAHEHVIAVSPHPGDRGAPTPLCCCQCIKGELLVIRTQRATRMHERTYERTRSVSLSVPQESPYLSSPAPSSRTIICGAALSANSL